MKPISDDLSYHKAAEKFLKDYYENNSVENISFGFAFQNKMAKECIQIGKSLSIKKTGLENAIIATYFANAGVKNISTQLHENSFDLLDTFFNESEYPVEDREVVKNAIVTERENRFADSKVQKIVCDAVNSSLAWPEILEGTCDSGPLASSKTVDFRWC